MTQIEEAIKVLEDRKVRITASFNTQRSMAIMSATISIGCIVASQIFAIPWLLPFGIVIAVISGFYGFSAATGNSSMKETDIILATV